MSHKFCLTFANIPFPPDGGDGEPTPKFDEHNPRCMRCGYDQVWLSHNTREHYCIQCDEWFSEDEEN